MEDHRKKRRLDLNDYSDDEEGTECSHTALTWRGDPLETLSDWTIDVKAEGGNTDVTIASYHVHKSVMGAGKWRSKYFENLLRQPASDNAQGGDASRKCVIVLKLCATMQTFECLLDHMYFGSSNIDGQNVVSLRYLSKKLKVKTLFDIASQHIYDDLTVETAPLYMHESAIFGDNKLKEEAIKTCASDISRIEKGKLLEMDSSDFKEILCSIPESNIDSKNLSVIVAEYLRKHSDVTDGSYFQAVCNPSIMPVLAPSESLFYLQLCQKWTDNLEANSSKDGVDSLVERGVKCCIDHWKSEVANSIAKDSPGRNSAYDSLRDDIKVRILEGALLNAKETLEKLNQPKNVENTIVSQILVSSPNSDSESSTHSDSSSGILDVSNDPIYN
jgi:hypothetical protein